MYQPVWGKETFLTETRNICVFIPLRKCNAMQFRCLHKKYNNIQKYTDICDSTGTLAKIVLSTAQPKSQHLIKTRQFSCVTMRGILPREDGVMSLYGKLSLV